MLQPDSSPGPAADPAQPTPEIAERRLIEAAGQGDRQAQERVVRAHLAWVAEEARRREGRGLAGGDLRQEGALALMRAIRSFAEAGEGDFESFARHEVAGHMDRALAEEAACVRDGEMLVKAAEDYQRVEVDLRRRLGRPGSTAELAEKLEWSPERTEEVGRLVADARRRHDEELLAYLDPAEREAVEEAGDEPD